MAKKVKVTKTMTKTPEWATPGAVLTKAEFKVATGIVPAIIPIGIGIELLSVDLDEDEITEAGQAVIRQQLAREAVSLKSALDLALRSPVWAWSSGGARDIVDSGELLSSGSVVASGMKLIVRYDSPYANLVHNGGYVQPYGNPNARPVYLPGRPWIASTINGGGPVPKWEPSFGD